MISEIITRLLPASFVADSVSKPGNNPVVGTPADYDMNYEDVSFKAEDGVEISAWLIKKNLNKVIVLSHFGIVASRTGYTPKGKSAVGRFNDEIKYLKTIKHLVDLDYTVLMYDQRNHGNSGKGTCEWITGGVEESKDILAAVNYVSNHSELANASIGLLSFCQGGNATAFAYGKENGLASFKNIKALMVIQPTYSNANFLHQFGFSDKQVTKAEKVNLERGGKSINDSSWKHIGKINVPTLLVQADDDPWTDLEKIKEYFELLQVEKEMMWVKCDGKRLNTYRYFEDNPEKMIAWFNKHLV